MGITIDGTKYLTQQEAAEYLELTYNQLASLVLYHRALDSIKLGGGRFVTLASVEEYKQKRDAETKAQSHGAKEPAKAAA